MKEEVHSLFDGFETDEETGEVLVPQALAEELSERSRKPEEEAAVCTEENAESGTEEKTEQEMPEEELPELQFDFDFGEEEFVTVGETEEDEDSILKSIDDALAAQMAATLGPVEASEKEAEEKKKKKNVWQRIPLWCRIPMIILLSLCLILGLLVGTKPGKKIVYKIVTEYLYHRMNIVELTPTPEAPLTPATATPEPTRSPEQQGVTPTVTPVPTVEPRSEEYCYNVLLIGVEALPQLGSGERSDTMILISINSRDKKIHMTSLMRDMYVQIPGRADDKLNSAYANGGAQLLIDTIELNLQVKIDGYVTVGFDSFEWIVDRLGGVEITLTAEEAAYLRRTDYISNPAYRNVVAGTQRMNGNQVLGYCRVRYVPTANGTLYDYGRTERQRSVLTKIFERYKDSNVFTMLGILNDCLPQVTTNISQKTMQDMLEMVVEERILSLDTMRIPVSGSFSDATVNGSQVLAVQWSKNIKALQEFIFGTEE